MLPSLVTILIFFSYSPQVYDDKKLAFHYMRSRAFIFDIAALLPLDLLQLKLGSQPMLRFPRFLKVSIFRKNCENLLITQTISTRCIDL